MEITELELSKLQLDPTQHFELIRVVHLASTRLDLAATLAAAEQGGCSEPIVRPESLGAKASAGVFGRNHLSFPFLTTGGIMQQPRNMRSG